MSNMRLIILIVIFLNTSCSSFLPTPQETCLLGDPTIIQKKEELLFQYWDLGNNLVDYNSTTFEQEASLESYYKRLNKKYDTSAISLMRASLEYEEPSDKENIQLVLDNKNRIRKVSCLEMKLMAYQNDRIDLLDSPSEFIAFLLKKESKKRLLYFTTNTPGVRGLGLIHGKIEEFIKDGWKLEYNLHNHNFFIKSKKYRGTVVPSMADAWVYKMEIKDFDLPRAIVTNGFHSMELDQKLMEELKALK